MGQKNSKNIKASAQKNSAKASAQKNSTKASAQRNDSETTSPFYPPTLPTSLYASIPTEPTPIIQKPANNQICANGNILVLPKDMVFIIMLLLDSNSQFQFANTCPTFYNYYLEYSVVILGIGYPNEFSEISAIMSSFKRTQCYMGSNHFPKYHFIQPEKFKDFQSNVRYSIKGLHLSVKNEELLSVISDLSEGLISSLTSLELTDQTINIATAFILSKLPPLKYLYFNYCNINNSGLSKIFANPSQPQNLELKTNKYPRVLKFPPYLKSLRMSGFQDKPLDVNMSECTNLKFMTISFYISANIGHYMGRIILPQVACLLKLSCRGSLFFIKDFQDWVSALCNLEELDLEYETLKKLNIDIQSATELTTDPDHLCHLDFSLFKNFKKLRIIHIKPKKYFTFTFPRGDGTVIDLELTLDTHEDEGIYCDGNLCLHSKGLRITLTLEHLSVISVTITSDFQIIIRKLNC